MKKKYRVTTRGKIVFSLLGLLLIYGLYSMLTPTAPEKEVESTQVVMTEDVSQETDPIQFDDEEIIEGSTTENETVTDTTTMIEAPDSTKTENCTTNKLNEDPEMRQLRLLEAAGFTVYYQPNAYYVPEGDIALIEEFAAIAKENPTEQIIIEGNVNKEVGPPEEWDTENVAELGYTRGLVIKNDLIKRGIDKDRIIIYNNEDEKPLNVDLSKESIALNRRTDVFFSQFMYTEIDTK